MSRYGGGGGGGGGRDTPTKASRGAGGDAPPGRGGAPGGGGGPGAAGYAPVRSAEDDKIDRVQREADVVLNIYRDNVAKMLERGDALTTLHEQTVELNVEAKKFKQSSEEVKNKMWWKNMRMTLILIAVCVVLALVILFPILKATGILGGGGGDHD
ncbi:synaptobrevin-domain-containing protein [Zopfochytrium polystomum]|nr:synaptobrevin-domain-containing protein [Zopfochytrium polystomum]